MATCEFNIAESYAESGAWSYTPCGKPAIEVWDKTYGKWRYFCAEHLESMSKFYNVGKDTITTMHRKQGG